jgi:hypothetical protein
MRLKAQGRPNLQGKRGTVFRALDKLKEPTNLLLKARLLSCKLNRKIRPIPGRKGETYGAASETVSPEL